MRGFAGPECLSEFGEGEARAEKGEFGLRVADRGKNIEYLGDLLDAFFNDIAGERNVSNRGPQQLKNDC